MNYRGSDAMLDGRNDMMGGGVERRRHERSPLLYSGSLHKSDDNIDCVIKDISASGARLAMERRLVEAGDCVLDIDGVGLIPSRVVWQSGDHAGVQFLSDPGMVQTWISAAWGQDAIRA
jgi:PilZ domain